MEPSNVPEPVTSVSAEACRCRGLRFFTSMSFSFAAVRAHGHWFGLSRLRCRDGSVPCTMTPHVKACATASAPHATAQTLSTCKRARVQSMNHHASLLWCTPNNSASQKLVKSHQDAPAHSTQSTARASHVVLLFAREVHRRAHDGFGVLLRRRGLHEALCLLLLLRCAVL